jgi:hypothetical protein
MSESERRGQDASPTAPMGAPPEQAFDRGFDGHARRQAVAGLALTPAERLAWLEETMATFRRWLGRARDGRPLRPS